MSIPNDDEFRDYLSRRDIRDVFNVPGLLDKIAVEKAEKHLEGWDGDLEKKVPLNYYSCVRLIYYCIRDGNDEEQKWDWTIRWLQVCINSNRQTNLFFDLYGLDREEEVKRILYKVDRDTAKYDESDPILPYLTTKDREKILNYLFRNWFLPRYDFGTASRLVKELNSCRKTLSTAPKRKINFSFDLAIGLCAFVLLMVLLISFAFVYKDLNKNLSQISPFRWVDCCSFSSQSPAEFYAKVYLFLIYVGSFSILFWKRIRSILLPRLIGGIIIGYIFLLSSDSLLNFSLQINPYEATLIIVTSICLSLLLLWLEIKRRLEISDMRIVWRTIALFSLSLLESTIIGLLVSDIFSGVFTGHIKKEWPKITSFVGPLVGTIYPKVVILFIPLALLVGLVLQLFWEEKPISQLEMNVK